MAIGRVTTRPGADDTAEPHTTAITTCSRMAEVETFASLATVEAHMRGLTRALQVVAVNDGAEWIQWVIDLHRPTAVRIVDFPHAAQRLSAIATTVWGEGQAEAQTWFVAQRHPLRHAGPEPICSARSIRAQRPRLLSMRSISPSGWRFSSTQCFRRRGGRLVAAVSRAPAHGDRSSAGGVRKVPGNAKRLDEQLLI